jgi:60 kDa SS-A/Ro ribonucleoprotein
MANPLRAFSTRVTAQSTAIPGTNQVANSAGGFAWSVDDWARLRRFLILGVDGGSYYASEPQLVKENATAVLRCLAIDGHRTVDEIVAVSVGGRAAKQQAAIFALAACSAAEDPAVRAYALEALPQVCRIGTHLFLFAGYVEQFRGWGRGLRRAVGAWYLDRDADSLAYQLVKYQQREGWSHRDMLRLAKPAPVADSATDLALRWAVGKLDIETPTGAPSIIRAFHAAQASPSVEETIRLVTTERLPWETLASEHLAAPEVWRALIPSMGLGALVRNLGRMTANGALAPFDESVDVVCRRLTDVDQIRRARLHPIQILAALRTYQAGHGTRGKLTWAPVAPILDALDTAFYTSFQTIEPSGKRTLLALDVSGSMAGGTIGGVVGLSPRVASAAMAAVTVGTERHVETIAFTDLGRGSMSNEGRAVSPITLTPKQRLDDIINMVSGMPFGGTDCALPMLYALDRRLKVDTFIIYTDSETWSGEIHPAQALRRYREKTGITAKLIVVGMVSNGFSIADPTDAGMLDVVGFDTAAPAFMADFAADRL